MTDQLHLIKLCVGVEQPEQLMAWQEQRCAQTGSKYPRHVTRMWPRRETELLKGGSLYWVMKGMIKARQRIVHLEKILGEDGIARCGIILEKNVVRTVQVPRRAFQGWRYLENSSAPADLTKDLAFEDPLPENLAVALANIGLR